MWRLSLAPCEGPVSGSADPPPAMRAAQEPSPFFLFQIPSDLRGKVLH